MARPGNSRGFLFLVVLIYICTFVYVRKNIDIRDEDIQSLRKMAADANKDLKPFIDDLVSVIVEFKDFASVKWLLKQVNKK